MIETFNPGVVNVDGRDIARVRNIATSSAYPLSVSIEEACAEVIRSECLLLDPEVRRSPERVRALLHPDFLEFGASGRVWDIESIIDSLASEKVPIEIVATDFQTTPLNDDVVLLTFKTETSVRVCLRSSTWVKGDNGKWLLRFHQGTIVPA